MGGGIFNSLARCGHLIQAQRLTTLPVAIQLAKGGSAWVWIQCFEILQSFLFQLNYVEAGLC